jgi:hypothetical protein
MAPKKSDKKPIKQRLEVRRNWREEGKKGEEERRGERAPAVGGPAARPKKKTDPPQTKKKTTTQQDAGYPKDEIQAMTKNQIGVFAFYGRDADYPTPDEVPEEFSGLDGSKSSLDACCAYLKTTKGGTEEYEDAKEAAEAAGANPAALHSPYAKKKK